MEHIIKKIKKGAKHTRLSAVEKAEMRSVLVRHIKANPVDNSVLSAKGIPSPFFNINNFRNKKGISILVIGGLLMSGSVSLAAENTVPGDVLFPVKVHVNENVRGTFSVTTKAKAEWEVRLVERRLEEVEKLAVIPDVSIVVQQIAEQNLEHYSERVKNRIARFEEDEDEDGAMETSSKLSDVFNTHERVLSGMNTNAVATSTEIVFPVVVVPSVNNEQTKDTLKKVRSARNDAEKKHNELKEKYNKNKVEESVKTEQKNLISLPVITQPIKPRIDISERKVEDERKEEIRSTVITQEASTTVIALPREETKKPEDKKREEVRAEDSKSDDND